MLRFLIRGLLGSFFITVFSFFLTAAGIVLPVGVNVLTFLSCAILGVPGLLLGLVLFKSMSENVEAHG